MSKTFNDQYYDKVNESEELVEEQDEVEDLHETVKLLKKENAANDDVKKIMKNGK